MSTITTTYTHAAPFIREAVMNATENKLNASTQGVRRLYEGQMIGLLRALKIMLASPEGEGSPSGFPDFHGVNEAVVLREIERYVGGPHRMIELGFHA